MKRYVFRKRRLGGSKYSLTNDVTHVKCEDYGVLFQTGTSTTTKWGDSGFNYYSLAAILANAPSFTNNVPVYARYKITGLSVRLASSADTGYLNTRFTAINGFPCQCVAFYPNLTGVDAGNGPLFNDRRLIADNSSLKPAFKYWKFPDNFFISSGRGLGVWSQTTGYESQTGQLSVYPTSPVAISADTGLFNYCITVYVTFSDKNI